MMTKIRIALPLLLAALSGQALAQEGPKITIPEGYTIEKVAGPPLIERPMLASFDPFGRLFVCDSSGFNLTKGNSELLVKNPPHSIRMLEDTDGDGMFDKSTVFADKMTFPMGALWLDGALYTASPPSIWKLEDTDNDGVADKRTEFVTKFQFGGNGCDLHGPYLGPDGRIYWANCRRWYDIKKKEGGVLKGKASGLFRIRPDGTEIEIVTAGGMDNPVEPVFTEAGEALINVNIIEGRPRVDAVIHCVEGGLYPKPGIEGFKKTGDLLPYILDLGWVATSGFMRARSDAHGLRNAYFNTYFNTHKIQRLSFKRLGATFSGEKEDFLSSENPDFHPTDIFEDADGSLLVLDTGGWFVRGCPTSRISKPQITGAIYRIRKKGARKVEDPRGLKIAWKGLADDRLIALLDDPRFAVRDRATHLASKRSVAPLREAVAADSARLRRNAVWALTRIDGPEARAAVRLAFEDKELDNRIAAIHSAGLHRDREALKALQRFVASGAPPVRRSAATALGRIGDAGSIPALFEGLRAGGDRILEHALIYALIRIADAKATASGLVHTSPLVRRGALIALDQMEGGDLSAAQLTPLLDPSVPALRETALEIVSRRPEWAASFRGHLRDALAENRGEGLRGIVVAFSSDKEIQKLVAGTLGAEKTPADIRLLLLEAIGMVTLEALPGTWVSEIGRSLEHPDAKVVRQAVSLVKARKFKDFDVTLLRLARDGKASEELRVEAIAAAAPRLKEMESALFGFLEKRLAPERPVLLRLAAARALGAAALTHPQLRALLPRLRTAGAMEMPQLLAAYRGGEDKETGLGLVSTLGSAAGLESLSQAELRQTLESYPDSVQRAAAPLLKKLDRGTEAQKKRLAELEPALSGGDAARGRAIFFGNKVSCSSCHRVGSEGGRVGPDFSKIGTIRTKRDLLEAIVFPSASLVNGYESYLIRTRDGAIYDGLKTRETADAIYLYTSERVEKRIPRASIDAMKESRLSVMPKGLDAQLSRQELGHLIEFLKSQR